MIDPVDDEGELPSFAGRARELDLLRQAVEQAREHGPLAVVIRGESGIGKTALIEHLVRGLPAAAALVLRGRCSQHENVAFAGLDEVVGSLADALEGMSPAKLEAVLPPEIGLLAQTFPVLKRVPAIADAPLARVAPNPQEQRNRLFLTLRALFGRLAASRMMILVIDDLHWADRDTLALLTELLRSPEGTPLLFIAGLRDDEQAAGIVTTLAQALPAIRDLALQPLPLAEATSLARRLLSGTTTVSPREIAADSEGHPLFIAELARRAVSARAHPRGIKLEDLLRDRIAHLEPDSRLIVELVALAGTAISQSVAARAAGAVAAADQLAFLERAQALRAAHLVRTGGSHQSDRIEPYHSRVRDAVLGMLPPAARAERHHRLAVAMEGDPGSDSEALATHWAGAGDPTRACRYALRAGDDAVAALAFDRAARTYQLALSMGLTDGEQQRAIQLRLAEALVNAGRGTEAAGHLLAAAQGASSDQAIALHGRAAEQLLRSGRIDEGVAAIASVLAQIGLKLPATPLRSLLSLVWRRLLVRLRGLRFREREAALCSPAALRRIDVCWTVAAGLGMVDTTIGADFQARALLLSLAAGEPIRIIRALALETAFAATGGSRTVRRTERLRTTALALVERRHEPYVRALLTGASGIAAYQQGRWQTALDLSTEAEQSLRDHGRGVAWELSTAQLFTVWARYNLGELEALAASIQRLLHEAEARGDLYSMTSLRTGLANAAWLWQDDPQGARQQANHAIAGWSSRRYHFQHYWDLLAQGQIDLYQGDGAGCRARLERSWPALASSLFLRIEAVRIEAMFLRGRAALAAAAETTDRTALLTETRRIARRVARERAPWAAPVADQLAATAAHLAGDARSALALLERSASGFQAVDMRLQAAAVSRQHGVLLGAAAGQARVAAADALIGAQHIHNADRLLAMLVPGFRPT